MSLLVNNTEPDKVYKYIGDDYNIKIAQSDNFPKNETNIELLECENILRKKYNLNDTKLTILQLEINKNNEQALTNQIEYAIYNENNELLNLSVCSDKIIKINYEIKNTSSLDLSTVNHFSEKGIDILNINDDFFNDICYGYSINNSDITLEDRVEEIYQNYSLCDNDCTYENANMDTMMISCKCKIKTSVEAENDSLSFTEAVIETFENSNIFVMKCYNSVFDFSNKSANYGFWILLILILVHIPLIIHYLIFGFAAIKTFIKNEMIKNNYIKNNSNPVLNKLKSIKIKKKTEKEINCNCNSSNNQMKNSDEICDNIGSRSKKNTIKLNLYNSNSSKINPPTINLQNKRRKTTKISSLRIRNKIIKKSNEDIKSEKQLKKTSKKIKNNQQIIQQNNYYTLIHKNANNSGKVKKPKSGYILNIYEYKEAIKVEDRSFWQILYISLLYNENILYAFVYNSPLEIRTLRMCLVIFYYSCNLALNALFYTNEKISEKYHYDGDNLIIFTLVNNITICVFSALCNFSIMIIFKILINPRRSFERVFRKEEQKMKKDKKYIVTELKKKKLLKKIQSVYSCMKIRHLIFIITEFILMLFFFYFITAFCGVYKSTQVSWILDWIVSFLISVLLEIGHSILIASLYKISVKYKLEIIYEIIVFIYNIC